MVTGGNYLVFVHGNFRHNTHLYFINRTNFWIPVTMNYNSVVTFVYEVRTSTYIVKIWWTPGPILQLIDKR